jgi:hypothetical protein
LVFLRTSHRDGAGDPVGIALISLLEDDFYTVKLKERYDVVCCWETFGLGADADQRRLLRRIAAEWLKPDGCVLMDVYSPIRPARDAGTERRLPPLEGVPGSVEMINRCYFDPFQSRWIDEWIPAGEPEKALAQTVRCYIPADFLLLLEGTGLSIQRMEVDGSTTGYANQQRYCFQPVDGCLVLSSPVHCLQIKRKCHLE